MKYRMYAAGDMGRYVVEYQDLLEAFCTGVKKIIGACLTGIYLHGSLAMGCFHAAKSDIDLIVIIKEDISNRQKTELMELFVLLNSQAPAKGLEISVVKRAFCAPFVYPTPFELHFSVMHQEWFLRDPRDYVEKMKGEDIDLAAHFTIIKRYGMVLWGEEIEKVFADVPRQNYVDSICCDIRDAETGILEQPVYYGLNLCRVLAFVRDGLYLSKKEGGEWGREHLPSECQDFLAKALRCYETDSKMETDGERAVVFAKVLLKRIRERIKLNQDTIDVGREL